VTNGTHDTGVVSDCKGGIARRNLRCNFRPAIIEWSQERQFAAFYSLVVCEFFRQTETP
jgi:hypothetical protein